MSTPRIWLTRPQDDSLRMAQTLSAERIPNVIAPLMEIHPQEVAWPQAKPEAILITSRYAAATLASVPPEWRDIPTYCVGPATARIATQGGMQQVVTGAGTIHALLPLLREALPAGAQVLYPSGEDIKVDVASLLRTRGIGVTRLIVYNAQAVAQLPTSIDEALRQRQLQGLILSSPRAARIASDLLSAAGLLAEMQELDIYCLSLEIAEAAAAARLNGRSLHACSLPSYEAMMELLLRHAIRTPA